MRGARGPHRLRRPAHYLIGRRFPALAYADYRMLWTGQAVSVVGSQLQFTAMNWHIATLVSKEFAPYALGLAGLFRFMPIIALSLIGGAIADIHDRRKILLITQSYMALVAVVLGSLTAANSMTLVSMYLLIAVNGACFAFDNPARQSLTPMLVPPEHLANAASLNSLAFQTAQIAGPAIAGLLIAYGNLAITYFVNAVSFGAVLVALAQIHPPSITHAPGEKPDLSIESLKEGLSFVRRTPILVWTMTLDFFATFFSSASSLLPLIAKDVLGVGATGYGILASASAAGSLAAGGAMSLLPTIRNQGKVIIAAVFCYGLATIAFGLSKAFWLSWVMLALVGASDTVSTILRQTIRQIATPIRLQGRSTSINMIFFMGGPQLGELEAGVVAGLIGVPGSVVVGGLGCVAITAWIAAKAKHLREFVSK